jgi:DNA-binding LacI/PurR family transcriptional regulator
VVQNEIDTRLAIQCLIDHGHSRIAYLGLVTSLYALRARQEGYRQAITRAGMTSTILAGTYSLPQTTGAIRAAMSQPNAPTAIFCSNGLMTRYALHALSAIGLSVPD